MKLQIKILPAFIFLIICIVACGCQRGPSHTSEIPYLLSPNYSISIAPFTQPLHPGQLISGQLPKNQGKITEEELLSLDLELREILRSSTKRKYNFIMAPNLPHNYYKARSTAQPAALAEWIAYGKKENAQLLLVPQVLDWHEREGSQAGVTNSAHVRIEFFLLNISDGQVMNRSVFEEKQVGLIDNLLSIGDFIKRKGQWVNARELAADGMHKAIRELGL